MQWTLSRITLCAALAIPTAGCRDNRVSSSVGPLAPVSAASVTLNAEPLTSVLWNERAVTLMEQRLITSNDIGARVLTYLSLAQYRAVRAAQAGDDSSSGESVAAAIGGASVTVLSAFFPQDAAALEAMLDADLGGVVEPGEATGRAIGSGVVAFAATDGFSVQSPGLPPVGPGHWISSGAPIAKSLYRTRPFFIAPASTLETPPPPAFGSAAFLQDLAEVRQISDTRTQQQIDIARAWAKQPPPGIAQLNLIADGLINDHVTSEREATRILAYANIAVFDAQIACFEAKFKYWFLRPVHADPAITMVIGLSNHPSYPSTHSCITSSFMTVIADAFPTEQPMIAALVEEAGLSRLYGGIHFRFDITAGQTLGRFAARRALRSRLN